MPNRFAHHFHRPPFAFLLALFLLVCHSADAGWYNVTNYVGHIGEYPVHVSIQKYESFGSGLNIQGSYYYDRHMAAIPLYGKLDENRKLSLCEIHSDDEYAKVLIHGSKSPVDTSDCPFHLKVVGRSTSGTWEYGGRRYEVVLNEIARLDDVQELAITGEFEIPFWGQTPKHLFFGAYELKGNDVRTAVKVVNKRSRQMIQVIHPEAHECFFGFYMTPIYMNVESYGSNGSEQVLFHCHDPRDGSIAIYRLNISTGIFDFVTIK